MEHYQESTLNSINIGDKLQKSNFEVSLFKIQPLDPQDNVNGVNVMQVKAAAEDGLQ